jgi:PhnB protein
MAQINPYLTFNGNCRQAMSFYKECLGGELMLQPVDGTPMADEMPEEMKQHILHSSLRKGNLLILASDMAREELTEGNKVSLMLECQSEDEIKDYYNNLSRGGEIIDPLATMYWGATFGAIEDKFGINWLLHYESKVVSRES